MRSLYISFQCTLSYKVVFHIYSEVQCSHLVLSAMLIFIVECNAHIYYWVQCSHPLISAMITHVACKALIGMHGFALDKSANHFLYIQIPWARIYVHLYTQGRHVCKQFPQGSLRCSTPMHWSFLHTSYRTHHIWMWALHSIRHVSMALHNQCEHCTQYSRWALHSTMRKTTM